MRFRLLTFITLLLLAAACQGPPPTMVVLVVTATPEQTADVQAEITPQASTITPSPIASTPTVSPTPSFATPTVGQIQVAEQVFEHGRMFWIQPQQQIWVLFDDGTGKGQWSVYPDAFAEGEPETDPSIVPPEGMIQPERGFGKLWRNAPGVREALGFGITPEFGYVSSYEYHPTEVDADGRYIGYHILNSLYQEKFRFNEATSSWEMP
ncbi:MAG: hypothetical protein K8L97_10895 [Anaerolineae bacterium]|nr:hypothetical protein [Anaerolineae bacterium]